jgi:hypothetical protein
VALIDPFFRFPGRTSEQIVKSLGRHRQSGAIIEISQVETVRTVGLQVDKVVKILSTYFGSPYGASPMTLYSPELTLKPV